MSSGTPAADQPDQIAIVLDDMGAAVTSLKAAGREWLVQSSGPATPPSATSSFVASGPRGWDEMAPTIVPCTVDGVTYPDHGDAWRSRWSEEAGWLVHRSSFGHRLARRSRNEGSRVSFEYRLTADPPRPVLWAAHPLVLAPPGSLVEIDGFQGEIIDVSGSEPVPVAWSAERACIDAVPEGGCRKYVLPPDVRVGSASVIHPDGVRLRFSWPTDVVRYLGIYLERRAFTTQACIAVEPMTGWYDSLLRAVTTGRVAVAGPDPLTWTLVVDAEEAP